MLRKRCKPPPRIILRRPAAAKESEIPAVILNDYAEDNVKVRSGLAFFKRNDSQEEYIRGEDIFQNQESTKSGGNVEGETILPSLADEIESYPCQICNDGRIFMTRAGLQKHAETDHLDNLAEILELADHIQKEWERRRTAPRQMDFQELNPTNETTRIEHNDGCHRIAESKRTIHLSTKRKIVSDKARDNHVCVRCQFCGLAMSRPSLLIRHMIRVHNRNTDFIANVSYPNNNSLELPQINFQVDRDGNLRWQCCGQQFKNKDDLLAHRADVHSILYSSPVAQSSSFVPQFALACQSSGQNTAEQEKGKTLIGDRIANGMEGDFGGLANIPDQHLYVKKIWNI